MFVCWLVYIVIGAGPSAISHDHRIYKEILLLLRGQISTVQLNWNNKIFLIPINAYTILWHSPWQFFYQNWFLGIAEPAFICTSKINSGRLVDVDVIPCHMPFFQFEFEHIYLDHRGKNKTKTAEVPPLPSHKTNTNWSCRLQSHWFQLNLLISYELLIWKI